MDKILSGSLSSAARAFLQLNPGGDLETWISDVADQGSLLIKNGFCGRNDAVQCLVWREGTTRRATLELVAHFQNGGAKAN